MMPLFSRMPPVRLSAPPVDYAPTFDAFARHVVRIAHEARVKAAEPRVVSLRARARR